MTFNYNEISISRDFNILGSRLHDLATYCEDYGLDKPLNPAEKEKMADSNLKPDTLYEGIAHQRTSTSLMELLSNLYAYSLAAVSEGAWTPSTRGKIPTFDALQEQLIDCIEMESIILRKLVKGHILD